VAAGVANKPPPPSGYIFLMFLCFCRVFRDSSQQYWQHFRLRRHWASGGQRQRGFFRGTSRWNDDCGKSLAGRENPESGLRC